MHLIMLIGTFKVKIMHLIMLIGYNAPTFKGSRLSSLCLLYLSAAFFILADANPRITCRAGDSMTSSSKITYTIAHSITLVYVHVIMLTT
jgi:hypothetical protein